MICRPCLLGDHAGCWWPHKGCNCANKQHEEVTVGISDLDDGRFDAFRND